MFKIWIYLLILAFLYSCNSFSDAGKVLRNEKIKNTDEFLVEKKDPLVYPPDYQKILEPGAEKKIQVNEEDRIKKMLKAPEQKDVSKTNSSSIENSILKKIRK